MCNIVTAAYYGVGVRRQPTLLPDVSSYYACPNATSARFTCHEEEVLSLRWIVQPYIPAYDAIKYIPGLIPRGSYPVYHRGSFVGRLTNLTSISGTIHLADLTSDLTFTVSEVENGTTITCKSYDSENNPSQKSIVFFHAGKR